MNGPGPTIAEFVVAAPMHLHAWQQLPLDSHPKVVRWTTERVEPDVDAPVVELERQPHAALPLDAIGERQARRDRCLAKLVGDERRA